MSKEDSVYHHVEEDPAGRLQWILTPKEPLFEPLFRHIASLKQRIKGSFIKPFDVSKGQELLFSALCTNISIQLHKMTHQKTSIGYDHYKLKEQH